MAEERIFEAKYEYYSTMVFKICLSYLGKREDAEEAMQDAFLSIYKSKKEFTNKLQEKYFVIRITINKCKDILRKQKRVPLILNNEFIANFPSIELEQQKILEVINKLQASQKEIIVLRYVNDLSIKEIAMIIGKSEVAVRKQIERAKKNLKLLWGEYYGN